MMNVLDLTVDKFKEKHIKTCRDYDESVSSKCNFSFQFTNVAYIETYI